MQRTVESRSSEKKFFRASPEDWKFGDSVQSGRVQRLHNSPSYEEILSRISKHGQVLFHKREQARDEPSYFRVVVRLNVKGVAIDLFHNSASGYRAQYFHNTELGECANLVALAWLAPIAVKAAKEQPKRTCPAWWVAKSLLDSSAKVWIHQGLWLHHAKSEDQQLFVDRWLKQQASSDANRRKKAIWSSLAPSNESQLVLKGGFLTLEGEPLGSLKAMRAKNLHELGFT